MLIGHLVTYRGDLFLLGSSQGTTPAYAGGQYSRTYGLVPYVEMPLNGEPRPWVWVTNQDARQPSGVELLPACPECRRYSMASNAGAAGWRCADSCPTGTLARVSS